MGLQYNKILTNDGEILLSPSSIAQLFDNEGKWYSTYIKGENKFSGNDNTYLGTLLHNRIEQYYMGEGINKAEELEYLESVNAVDQWSITEALEPMYKAFIEQYAKAGKFGLINNRWEIYNDENKGLYESIFYPKKPDKLEETVQWKPSTDIVLGGSIDAIMGDTILDWKTSTKSKTSLNDYKMQLYSYALICRNNGMTINNVGIVNITKPTTKGEVKVNVIIEPIDESYMEWFIEQLKLKIKKIRFTKDNPELESMLWMENPYSFRQ